MEQMEMKAYLILEKSIFDIGKKYFYIGQGYSGE
jgi:hypothetical protein